MPGGGEILVILILVLLLFGPDKLPDLARQVGRGVRELNKMRSNLSDQFNLMSDEETPRHTNAPSSTRNATNSNATSETDDEAADENASDNWETYAARQRNDALNDETSRENQSPRDDFGRDEDDIAEDFTPQNLDAQNLESQNFAAKNDESDWRNCEEEPPARAETGVSPATSSDEFPTVPRAVARAAAPNKLRRDDANE